MKLVSFEIAGRRSFGVVIKDRIIDLAGKLGPTITSLREALDAGAINRIHNIASQSEPTLFLSEVTCLPPIPNPDKILCVGVNYAHRNEEYKDGTEPPKYPSIFPRFPSSFVGHGSALKRPLESTQLDYEGEITIIIGKRGRRISVDDAESYVAGLTCMNEGTIRDWVKHGKFNVTQGKNFDASGSIGPWMVTADEFSSYDNLKITTRVNGEVRQQDTTANLIFSFRQLIHYISLWTTLEPGDVISTGTPIGAGVRFDPPRYLVPGDVVEVDVGGVGVLSNVVVDEANEEGRHAQ